LIATGSWGMLCAFLIWNLGTFPQSPDPSTGRIYRLSQHGIVVYQTKTEHILYWSVVDWSVALLLAAGLLIAIYDWISDKSLEAIAQPSVRRS
jgi:hypothetical protein